MRASATVIVVVVICLAVLALYWFVGRSQLFKQVQKVQSEVAMRQADLEEIDRMEQEIPSLLAQLPTWQRQYELFRSAIPPKVDDHRFLSAIISQLDRTGSEFISSGLTMGGLWLDGLSQSQFEQLEAAGLDVSVAKQIKVAYYSLDLAGDYKDILDAFEGLKRYGRLYTIDQVRGPAGGAAGSVVQTVDKTSTPIAMTGYIFFGIPENYFNATAIERVFAEKGSGAAARATAASVKAAGRMLIAPPSRPIPQDDPVGPAGTTGTQAGGNLISRLEEATS